VMAAAAPFIVSVDGPFPAITGVFIAKKRDWLLQNVCCSRYILIGGNLFIAARIVAYHLVGPMTLVAICQRTEQWRTNQSKRVSWSSIGTFRESGKRPRPAAVHFGYCRQKSAVWLPNWPASVRFRNGP
jgi:hypothetical protein